MSEKTISIGFTNEEYSKILKSAQNEGMSVAQYIKSMIIPNEFNEQYKNLMQKIINLKPDIIFTVKDLWEPDDWNKISRGVKFSLGKHFYNNVETKNIDNVIIKGFCVSGIMCYIKQMI
ncbi:MAG: single-stranded DNA-binding protein [Treponema sp.]|jgi:ABC-type Fe3+-hydroxamate transport system substrate-binding protein|nr:single-stranded DNA-binding protein [Treponema sp.]